MAIEKLKNDITHLSMVDKINETIGIVDYLSNKNPTQTLYSKATITPIWEKLGSNYNQTVVVMGVTPISEIEINLPKDITQSQLDEYLNLNVQITEITENNIKLESEGPINLNNIPINVLVKGNGMDSVLDNVSTIEYGLLKDTVTDLQTIIKNKSDKILASNTNDGLMSKGDKIKLDGMDLSKIISGVTPISGNVIINGDTIELDCSNSQQVFTHNVTKNTKIVLKNLPANSHYLVMLKLTNGGSFLVSHPTGTKFIEGKAPDLIISGLDILFYFVDKSGDIIYGNIMNDLKL